MSICGKDGGIAPIAPGPLSSIKDSIKFDISVILSLIEPKVYLTKTTTNHTTTVPTKCNKLPSLIQIDMYCHPITREQRMKII
jgi:hypothetical protein